MSRDGPPQPAPYPADKARGGEIVLRTRLRRIVFIAGLIGVFVVLLLLAVLS